MGRLSGFTPRTQWKRPSQRAEWIAMDGTIMLVVHAGLAITLSTIKSSRLSTHAAMVNLVLKGAPVYYQVKQAVHPSCNEKYGSQGRTEI